MPEVTQGAKHQNAPDGNAWDLAFAGFIVFNFRIGLFTKNARRSIDESPKTKRIAL